MNSATGQAGTLVIVVMGVAGSGKSTVAERLGARLGWSVVDGDSFHTPGHVAQMRAGLPLGEADRAPWLAAMAAWIDGRLEADAPGILACSALRRAYRETLTRGRPGVRVVYLDGSRSLIGQRIAARTGHFMPAALLDSQFAILEPPAPDEGALAVPIADSPDSIAATIARRLGLPSTGQRSGTSHDDRPA